MHSIQNSNTFLSYYNKIDKYLSTVLWIKKFVSYGEKIDLIIQQWIQWSQVLDQYQSKFLYFGELRNQLVHGFSLDQKHFIVVSDHAVSQIKSLYAWLTSPLTVGEVFGGVVYMCELADSLWEVITIMRRDLNTHVPVYDAEGVFVEMLSESTIAYRLADQIEQWESIDLASLSVGDISLENTNDTFVFVQADESVYDVRKRFVTESVNMKRLGAVFITQTGRSDTTLLWIITAMDLYHMTQAWILLPTHQ